MDHLLAICILMALGAASSHQPSPMLEGLQQPQDPMLALPPLDLYMLDEATDARCMDGSPFGYYFRAASNATAATKWVIELQGGGWCYDEGDCYARTLASYSNGVLGSSVNWTQTIAGYFLENEDWNRVFLRYCSGASFTGYQLSGVDASGWDVPGHPGMKVPEGTKLWFRGAANIADTVAALQRDHGMATVDELIVTGSSAGGLATMLNVDRIAKLVGAKRVAGLADAGFFKYEANHTVNHYDSSANYTADMRYVYNMVNATVLSEDCRAAQTATGSAEPAPKGDEVPPAGEWNCIMAATAIEYVESPMFLLQSRFDHFQLSSIAGISCMNDMPYGPPWSNATCTPDDKLVMAAYGADLAEELARVIAAPSDQRAVFLSACIVHGQQSSNAWTKTTVDGVTPQQAWRAWYGATITAADSKWIEVCDSGLPCNQNDLVCAPY